MKKGRSERYFQLFLLFWLIIWISVTWILINEEEIPKTPTRLQEPRSSCLKYPKCNQITHLPTTTLSSDCTFDLRNHTEYLPDLNLLECLKQTKNSLWKIDLQLYKDKIRRLQNPSKCDHPDSSLNDHSWHVVKFTSHGHGVNAFTMAINVGNHWDRGIPVLPSRSAYRYGSHREICSIKEYSITTPYRGWSCHMSPLSNKCSLDDPITQKAIKNVNLLPLEEANKFENWCKPNGMYIKEYGRCKCKTGYLPSEDGTNCLQFNTDPHFQTDLKKWKTRFDQYHQDDDYAMRGTEHWISRLAPGEVFPHQNDYHDPAHWKFKRFITTFPVDQVSRLKLKYGFFWWMLQNIWILHETAPNREKMEKRVIELLGSNNPKCIAVQVRRGDSCDDSTARHRTCPKLDVYINQIKKLREKYLPKGENSIQVYLASDDPSAIEEAKQYQKIDNTIEWKWQKITRSRYVNGKAVDNNPDLFSDEAMDELYFDLWALSFCQIGFVASFASSVAWNAYGLAVGRAGYYIPFISVDHPWGHKILGGHHAKENIFDGTFDVEDLLGRESLFES